LSAVSRYSYFTMTLIRSSFVFFFFNDTSTTEIYTLSLHDALPISALEANFVKEVRAAGRKHIVKLSALGGRESMFPSGHCDSEENIEASRLPYTFLRPNGFMQNLVNYNAGTIRSQNAFYGCQGNGAVSIID